MKKSYPSFTEVQEVREKLKNISYDHWINDDFLTWKWWLLIVLSIIPWLIWWRILDKKRVPEILLYGMFISIFATIFDNIGTDLIWWEYPDKLFQMIPPLIPADISLIPCLMMVVYQWGHTWKKFLLLNFLLSLFGAYMGEPFFIMLNFYELNEWKLIYSLCFYNIAGLLGRWIVLKVYSISQSHREKG